MASSPDFYHFLHAPPFQHFYSLLPPPKTAPSKPSPLQPKVLFPILLSSSPTESIQHDSADAQPSNSLSPVSNSLFPGNASASPATTRITGLNPAGKRRDGPAFVGQVFSMCDVSGTGLMAVSTNYDLSFISQKMPGWIKNLFATIIRSEKNSPVFRFFLDLGDAVSYVKTLNIPSGMVGACRLDLAYEHFKGKPHLFQFVPNEKQVKAAKQLLKKLPKNGGNKNIDGVPVFSAQNLDIAITTTDGIKWYTPYFFDKKMLDEILEDSVDQHFHTLIQNRHMHRRQDVIDDSLTAEVMEESGDNLWDPPEVQEMLEEVGHSGIPLHIISKFAEMQMLYTVDKIILGNRWLRRATGIQPKFPYMVDSFEKRSAASLRRVSESSSSIYSAESGSENKVLQNVSPGEPQLNPNHKASQGNSNLWILFRDFLDHLWPKRRQRLHSTTDARGQSNHELEQSPFLPKITMVGISTREAGQMTRGNIKKTMDDLTRKLEEEDQSNNYSRGVGNFGYEDRDPLFVANVSDCYSRMGRTGSARWVHDGNNL